jgi:two-component system, NtrC family, response regulator HydG
MSHTVTHTVQLGSNNSTGVAFLSGAGVLRRPLRRTVVRIGRERGNNISPPGAGLSRFHAELRRTDEGWEVVDLSSKNGVFVGGARVTQALLPDRAELRFGDVVMYFEHQGEEGLTEAVAEPLPGVVGRTPRMLELADLVRRVAPTDLAVPVMGESGVGKELVARSLHDLSGRKGPWIEVNCATLMAGTAAVQLFGATQGAYTSADRHRPGCFEEANGGTLFLDEIAELSLEVQAQLLRVLETKRVSRVGASRTRKVDVRVVCATHRDLGEMVAEGTFRSDLYYRLMVFPLTVPPLRDRRGDVIAIARHLLSCFQGDYFLSSEAERELKRCKWPGNVRELRNVLQRAALLSDGQEIGSRHISLAAPKGAGVTRAAPSGWTRLMVRAVAGAEGNLSLAAKRLGVSRSTLYRRLGDAGLAGLSRSALMDEVTKLSAK